MAEVVAGELARRLGFRVPELVTIQIDAELGRGEPDEEIQDLLRASVGCNLGMDPTLDVEAVRAHLQAVRAVCRGGADAGPAGQGSRGERFRWLVAPRSTVVQPSPVHTGISADLDATLGRLLDRMVLAPAEPPSASPMS